MRTLKIYSLGNFQISTTISLTVVAMLYIIMAIVRLGIKMNLPEPGQTYDGGSVTDWAAVRVRLTGPTQGSGRGLE